MSSDKVLIFDTTLRDGEQSPGISLNKVEKLEIAQMLAKLNVDVIEAGFPIASIGDFEAVQAIAREVQGPTICGLARAVDGDIDRAWEAIKDAEKPRIHTFIATSPIHMEHKLRMSPEQVADKAARAVARAKSYTNDVEFSPEDAARSNVDVMLMVLQAAVDAGATTLNIPDTVGYSTPHDFAERIRAVKENIKGDFIISTHCHNDLGMATANSMAGVLAGARQVEVAINGIGERAGNAALEEIVMAIKMKKQSYNGVYTDVVTQNISQASRLVSRLTGYPVQYNKAIVGRNAFAHESGIHQDGVIKKRETYEIMDPSDVGAGESQIILGKHSGRNALKTTLDKMDITLSSEELDEVFVRFKELADRKTNVTKEDLEAITSYQKTGAEDDVFEIEELSFSRLGLSKDATAEVVLLKNKKDSQSCRESGNGLIDAGCKAIRKITGIEAELVEYTVNSVTGGVDALADVVITLRHKGAVVAGHDAHTDVTEASVRAYLGAVNRLLKQDAIKKKAQGA